MVEHVLRAVEAVPRGRVTTYGAIAGLMGGTARQVGRVLRYYGSNVTWWRVTDAAGDLPEHLRQEAAEHWAVEGITWKPNRHGCRIAEHRVDLDEWATAYDAATRDLPPYVRGSAPPRRPEKFS